MKRRNFFYFFFDIEMGLRYTKNQMGKSKTPTFIKERREGLPFSPGFAFFFLELAIVSSGWLS